MQKICRQCKTSFEITDQDLAFYYKISPVFAGKKYSIPAPTLCPDCRQQRRLAFRNERKLYHRKCDLTGQQIISLYSPDKPYKVYDQKEWWGDKWDALDYGRDYDFNKSFFEQFNDLMLAVPRPSILTKYCENSDYAPWAVNGKNLYLSAGGRYNEDCFYGMFPTRCKDCMDFIMPVSSELCYEVVDCLNCYHVLFSQLCEQCRDCFFCYDCQNCNDCFNCSGLRHKQYCFENVQYTEEVYREKLAKMTWSYQSIKDCQQKLEKFKKDRPHICLKNINTEDCLGDFIKNSHRVFYGFDVQNCEDCSYAYDVREAKDSYDIFIGAFNNEQTYECHSALDTKYSLGINICWDGNYNLYYCDHCFSANNLFGCVGLKRGEYCILNKQYSREEYKNLAPKIIEHMEKTGEWGEFFPIVLSPFDYNETVANEYFPLQEQAVIERGWKWHNEEFREKQYIGPNVEIPDKIKNVDDSICEKILLCEVTSKPYKIIPQELAFYKKMNLPIPRKCPDQRHKERLALRNPRKLFDRTCSKCQKAIKTTYAPDRPEIVYCEECYLKEVY